MKNRPARVRELIQRELGTMIARELTFDAALVTVQSVDLTADFKHCHVHVGVMGSEREQRDALHQLGERRPFLQHELGKRVILKYTPHLHFHLDTSVARGTQVMEILRQIDEVTPPESAEDAARRTDAFSEGDINEITGLDTEETAPEPDAETPKVARDPDRIKEPRSIRGALGRNHSNQDHDDDE